MDAVLREQKLQEIKEKDNPVDTKRMMYRGETKAMEAYLIDVEYLIFNQYNGRIGTHVKTYEKEHGPIDAATKEGEELIAKFLWDSKRQRNKETLKDLKEKGQMLPGIVTKDGVIIDGNRRCMLLKKIEHNGPTYFTAVILDDTIGDNPREIRALETTFQMGIDEKVDYNPIEKYLKCRDLLKEDGFTKEAIARMMGEKPSDIEKYCEILELMEDYLATYGYEGMYTLLNDESVEGPFVDLRRYLKKQASGSPRGRDWSPEKEDIAVLRDIYFDYIRAEFRTAHYIRNIGDPSKGKGFFSNKRIWEDFSKEYQEKIEPINEKEKSFEDFCAERPDLEKREAIKQRDLAWKNEVGTPHSDRSRMNTLLRYTSRKLEDHREATSPMELLKRAKSTLDEINPEIDSFQGKMIKDISHQIRKLAEKFIKIVEKKAKD